MPNENDPNPPPTIIHHLASDDGLLRQRAEGLTRTARRYLWWAFGALALGIIGVIGTQFLHMFDSYIRGDEISNFRSKINDLDKAALKAQTKKRIWVRRF